MTTRKLNGFRHTDIASAIPDSNKASRAAWFELADAILLTSLFKLFRSDLYSLSLARSTAFTFGCRLLASRSIFRIWRNMGKAHIQPQKYGEKKKEENNFCNKQIQYQRVCFIQSGFYFRNLLPLLLCKSTRSCTIIKPQP